MSNVRVRVAPSPTGPTHLGTAYQALFDRVFADRFGGRFVLRIEDTDQSRSRPEYEEQLIRSLRWTGLVWDEGPDVGGPHGPYRQSDRLGLYRRHAGELVAQGHAYPCFCTLERLAEVRAGQLRDKVRLGYDGHCRAVSAADAARRTGQGEPHVIRLRVPDEGTVVVHDRLRGEIRFDCADIDDQVLLKSDGFPTYHLAVVVDDHHMRISHVIRGEEWIPSTPKHLLLYERFGWEAPEHIHLPLLLNPDGSKMSKRRNPTSIEYYRRAGYLPEALLNYLALMAYPPISGEEKFTRQALTESFDPDQINLGGSIFDLEKLSWLNGRYIREDRSPSQLLDDLKGWLLNDAYIAPMLPLMQERMETLGDFLPRVAFLFARRVEPSGDDLVPGERQPEEVAEMLQTAIWALEAAPSWSRDDIESALRGVAAYRDWPVRQVTVPLTVALCGQRVGPPLFESAQILGIDLTRMRLLEAMRLLGGLSKKKAGRLEKAWNDRAPATADPKE